MNAQQLRNSILQEAIEGRLVPQDPNDEPASVLLERIREEKRRLVKEGKLKKKDLIETPITEEEIPFEIPESWEWVRFSNIYWQLTDGTHSTPKYTMSGIPFLSVKDMSSGKLSFSNTKYISPEEHSVLSQRCHPQKGDLLLSKVGTTGIPLIIDTDKEFSIFVSLALIKFFPDLIDSRFLLYMINSPLVQLQAADNTRGVGNKNWVLKAISDTIMVLPPLAEQHRIVAKIEELLPKVEEYGKAQDELNKLNAELPERLKKSILQEAIEGRLVPQDPNDEPASVLLAKIRKEKEQLVKEGKLKKKDLIETPISEEEIPFEIPESWEWVRIKVILSLQAGKNVTSADIHSEQNDVFKYPCYGGNGLRGYVKNYNNEGSYPLIGRQGALCGNVNMAHGQFWATEHAVVTDGWGMTDVKWQSFFLIALNLNKYATATAQPGLAVSNIIEVPIPLPPLAEQKRIVAKIEELLAEIDKLKV